MQLKGWIENVPGYQHMVTNRRARIPTNKEKSYNLVTSTRIPANNEKSYNLFSKSIITFEPVMMGVWSWGYALKVPRNLLKEIGEKRRSIKCGQRCSGEKLAGEEGWRWRRWSFSIWGSSRRELAMDLKMESDLLLSLSPSFNSYCSVNLAIVDRVVHEHEHQTHFASISTSTAACLSKLQNSSPGASSSIHGRDRKHQISNDFEFSSVPKDSESSPVSAEDIIHNGQILPVFPISKRDQHFGVKAKTVVGHISSVRRRILLGELFGEDRDPPSSSSPEEEEDLKRIPAVSMDRASSGRNEKRWRFRNIIQRSNSEAKESFVVLSPKRSRSKNQNSPKSCVDKRRAKFVSGRGEAVTSPPQEYSTAGLYLRSRPAKEVDRRWSFLPYRRDLIGFFANVY